MTAHHVPGLLGGSTNQPKLDVGTLARVRSPGPQLGGGLHRSAPMMAAVTRLRVLRVGMVGPDVVFLQRRLNLRLHLVPPLPDDGDFGPATLRVVRTFQARVGLAPDGVIGPATWLSLQSSGTALRDVDGGKGGAGARPSKPNPSVTQGTGATTKSAAAEAGKRSSPWMSIARKEVGTTEIAGSANNPRILEYHATTTLNAQSDEIAWCSSFVNWVLRQADYHGTNSAAAASWVNWGVPGAMEEGAIVVIKNGRAAGSSLTASGNHVGFLVEETDTHYIIVGGNQSDQVKESRFRKASWTLRACRWPVC